MKKTSTYHLYKEQSSWHLVDVLSLAKVRLTSLVVLTAVGAYFVSSGLSASFYQVLMLAIGGFGVTAAANAINQVLELEYDAMMTRTKERPLPSGSMTKSMAVLLAGLFCVVGVTALSTFNSLAAFFGLLAFVLYAFVYTPLKRYSRSAVFVGAIAGAMPMLIGVVAFDGKITLFALFMFLIQFAWQFPHFWAIAFLGFDDYKKAEFNFVPVNTQGRIDRSIALSSLCYGVILCITVGGMFWTDTIGLFAFITLSLLSVWFLFYALNFNNKFDRSSARRLMFSSLVYIPLFLVLLIIDLTIK